LEFQSDLWRSEKMVTSIRSSFQRGLWLVFALLAIASTAQGDMVSVQVTGEVTYSDFDSISVGSPVTGLYTYDDTLVPLPSIPFNGWYRPVVATLGFADGSSVSSDDATILVNNNSSGIGTTDEYGVTVDPSLSTTTGAFAGYTVEGWMMARQDPTGTAWDGIALPDPETVLALLPVDASMLLFYDADHYLKVLDFEITDLSVVPVPIPGALLLGAIGLSCSAWLARRKAT
jgi:hypothetical protein